MEDLELISIIENKLSYGEGEEGGQLTNQRQVIFDRYMGELYGNEQEGSSKFTTREVFETIEWAMPSIMRVFSSGDRVVEFDPVDPQDEMSAQQETDAVQHIFNQDNNGFVILHQLIKSALLNPNSYLKVVRDEREVVEIENYYNMNDIELSMIVNDDEVEVVGYDLNEYGLYDIEIKRTMTRGKIKVIPIPEEEMEIDDNHIGLNLDDCEFTCHRAEKTFSDLVQLGYKAEDLRMVQGENRYTSEETNRRFYTDENQLTEDESHEALRKFTVEECIMLLDWDDDDIAERRRVIKIGNKIFENEPTDYMPYVSAATILMPHKHIMMSVAESVMDLQDLKTYFMRQLITNMGKMNNPRTLVKTGANLDDVLSNNNNGVIRITNDGDVQTEPVSPVIGQVIPLLELIDMQKEGRSGITRNSMGLDADILAKSTEGAFMGAIEKADQRIEFLVRVLAETCVKDIFLKIHHLELKHGDTKWMKLNGQWSEVNPTEWRKRESMTCNVGIGLSSRRQKMSAAQVIIMEQDKLIQQGGMGTMLNPQNVYNARRLLTESVGEKNVDKYFMNPENSQPQQPQPQQPDPNMVMIEANAKIEQDKRQVEVMRLQQDAQIKSAQMQFDQAKAQREDYFKQVESEYNRQIAEMKVSIETEKVDNAAGAKALEAQIDQLEMQLKDAQNDEKLAMDQYKTDKDNLTKIQLKEMDLGAADGGEFMAARDEMNNTIMSMSQIISDMNQPKEIVRDDNGSPVGVRNIGTGEVRTIIKDAEGLPVGIQ